MNREEKTAFLRGFFEGDGSLYLRKGSKNKNDGRYRYFGANLKNTDPFLIKTIKKMLIDLGLIENKDFYVYIDKRDFGYLLQFSASGQEKFLTLIRDPKLETIKGQKIEFYHYNKDLDSKKLAEIYEKQWKPRETAEYRQNIAKKLNKSLRT